MLISVDHYFYLECIRASMKKKGNNNENLYHNEDNNDVMIMLTLSDLCAFIIISPVYNHMEWLPDLRVII